MADIGRYMWIHGGYMVVMVDTRRIHAIQGGRGDNGVDTLVDTGGYKVYWQYNRWIHADTWQNTPYYTHLHANYHFLLGFGRVVGGVPGRRPTPPKTWS